VLSACVAVGSTWTRSLRARTAASIAVCNEEECYDNTVLSFSEGFASNGILFDTLVMGSRCRREVLELHTHDLSSLYSIKKIH